MKHLIISFFICTFIFFSNTSKAQYIPTAVDSAVWTIGCNRDFMTGQYQNLSVQYTNGDTIINNVNYYKVYGMSNIDTSPKLMMFIRDNEFTNTVHAINFDICTPSIDVLFFDFSPFITAGTTHSNCLGSYDVLHIDTINIYGINRRRFHSHFGGFIEGIGSNTHGLSPLNTTLCDLIDYCRGTPEDCGAYAWVSTKDIRTYKQGKLYPNPARTQSKLELQSYLENGTIQVYNLLGQLQYQQYFSGQEAILDISNLNQGMYMIQVFDDEQLVFGEKLLVIE